LPGEIAFLGLGGLFMGLGFISHSTLFFDKKPPTGTSGAHARPEKPAMSDSAPAEEYERAEVPPHLGNRLKLGR
jgi:hypothetical protein